MQPLKFRNGKVISSPHVNGHVIINPCVGLTLNHVSKRGYWCKVIISVLWIIAIVHECIIPHDEAGKGHRHAKRSSSSRQSARLYFCHFGINLSINWVIIQKSLDFSLYRLTHWYRDEMADISQTIISNAFSWMRIYEFWSIFHWCLFLGVQLTIFQDWFHLLNQLSEPIADAYMRHAASMSWFWYHAQERANIMKISGARPLSDRNKIDSQHR